MPKSKTMIRGELLSWVDGGTQFLDSGTIRVGLFTTAPTVQSPDLVSEFGLPTTGNYPPQGANDISGPNLRHDGRYTYSLSGMQWLGDADQLPVTFLGFYVIPAPGAPNILAWRMFETPVVMMSTENILQLTVRLSTSNQPNDVEVSVVNG